MYRHREKGDADDPGDRRKGIGQPGIGSQKTGICSLFRLYGAALLTADGHRYLGGNIENASYGATNCAERTAFFKAVSEGEREFTAIAIAGGISGEAPVEYAYPCGICRQVMQEFCRDFVIYVVNSEQDYQRYTLKELLPFGFGGDAIR